MTFRSIITFLSLLTALLPLTGCRRSSNDVWEDTKSGSRHINRGFKSLGGKCGDSRAIRNPADFDACDDDIQWASNSKSSQYDFVPLADQSRDSEVAMAEYVSRQPNETPGDPGSSIPGIDNFRDPSTMRETAGVFRNIEFGYNSYQVKGEDNQRTIRSIAQYMQNNPNTYVFVEGHCDQRGPEAYNLSLGSRRANAVRNELLQYGVNADNLFTISYGKERPLISDNSEEAWAKNRRSEFKVYQN